MDQKTWLWRRKSTDLKIVGAAENVKGNEEEIEALLSDKAELENNLRNVNDKLSAALLECNAKDDLIKKQAKAAEEAVASQEKLETKLVSLKHELDEALQQRAAAQERLTHLDAALKECMQQLRFVRDEQEQRIHDAVMKTSKEYERSRMILEENLAETNRSLAKIGVENTHLSKALIAKDKTIDELSKQKAQLEVDLNALLTRLESSEKENASLKYEVRVIEKELEIRNEEREFNRRTADASHKQHLDSVKKIAKLEAECQRLRVLVRKRLPGPAALAKMKNEVEILGRDSSETRRRRSNSSCTGFVEESASDSGPDTPNRKISSLIEKLCAVEEENKSLKEALNKNGNELQLSRAMYARTASKLSQVESNVDELSKGQTILQPSRSVRTSHELSLASLSDVGSDDKASCAESWASALISELEHFKHGKLRGSPTNKTFGASDINLMDDFVEMERLAIISVDTQSGSPHVSSDDNNSIFRALKTDRNEFSSEPIGGKITGVQESSSGISNQEIKSKDESSGWLQDILKVFLEQSHATQRKPDEMLEDVRVALANINHASPTELRCANEPNIHHFGAYIPCKPTEKSLMKELSGGISDVDVFLSDKSSLRHPSDLGKSVGKIIELIEGITQPYCDYITPEILSKNDGTILPYKSSESSSGYMVRVFQWKVSELSAVLHQFVHSCYDLLSGKSNVNDFAHELCSALDWIINHCFSLRDVSSMRDAVKKHYDWDETRSESEVEIAAFGLDKLLLSHEQLSSLPTVPAVNGHKHSERDGFQPPTRHGHKEFKAEVISVKCEKEELEVKFKSDTNNNKSFMSQLQESEKTIASLQTELDSLKRLKEIMENQIENYKLMKEDLEAQLTIAKLEQSEACQKFSSMEVELENKTGCCEELEATCLDLQLQLESLTKKATPENELQQEEKQLRTDWEITAASEKLAECQETILNLGKQLKALASPSEVALFDKVISTSTDANANSVPTTTNTGMARPQSKIMNQRSSLLDRMLAEDSNLVNNSKSNIKQSDNYSGSAFVPDGVIEPLEKILLLNGSRRMDNDFAANSLTIVPSKKQAGGSLWRKLWKKKKASSKKLPIPFGP